MNAVVLKSSRIGCVGKMFVTLVWIGVWLVIWAILQYLQVAAYTEYADGTYAGYIARYGDIGQHAGVFFRYWLQWIVAIIAVMTAIGGIFDFIYVPTIRVQVSGNDRGYILKKESVEFLYSQTTEEIQFNRILKIQRIESIAERMTDTETIILNLVYMKGVEAEEVSIEIPSVTKLGEKELKALEEYSGASDVHYVNLMQN